MRKHKQTRIDMPGKSVDDALDDTNLRPDWEMDSKP